MFTHIQPHLRLQAAEYLVVRVVDEVSLLLVRAPLPLGLLPTEVGGATSRHVCSSPLLLPRPGDKLLFSSLFARRGRRAGEGSQCWVVEEEKVGGEEEEKQEGKKPILRPHDLFS